MNIADLIHAAMVRLLLHPPSVSATIGVPGECDEHPPAPTNPVEGD